jgi:hypothetical protein
MQLLLCDPATPVSEFFGSLRYWRVANVLEVHWGYKQLHMGCWESVRQLPLRANVGRNTTNRSGHIIFIWQFDSWRHRFFVYLVELLGMVIPGMREFSNLDGRLILRPDLVLASPFPKGKAK